MKILMLSRQPIAATMLAAVPIVLLALLLGCTAIEQQPVEERHADISSRDQDYLATYGDWVQAPPYGEVWCPRVTDAWEPFCYGQWVWSDQGWVWESYEPYGWLVYHHGNWDHSPELGWFWIPAQEWSPAAVQWTEFGDYVGWAPSPPSGVILPTPWSPDGARVWKIVEARDFAQDNVGKYKVVKNVTNISVGTPITDRQQPDVRTIEKVTKRTFVSIKVERQPTALGSHTYYKMVLPPPDTKRIKTETAVVEKNVLVKKEAKPAVTKSRKPATNTESGKDKKSDKDKKEADSKTGSDQATDSKSGR